MKTPIPRSIRPFILATALACAPLGASAASTSELLEKGIYTEETKGDLDAAITIYQQLVGDARTAQTLAAQAQYRLGLCYQKKNRAAEAIAAFEKLVRDFPGEKELVAKAREHLPADIVLEPVTWVDGERLQMILTVGSGKEVGAVEIRADLVESGGRKVWRVGRRMAGGGDMVSTVDVDPETFRPLASTWKHTMLGEVSAVFRPGEVEMTKVGSTDPTKLTLEKPVFDNEECFHLPRRLPLQVGYKATVPVIATLAGGAIIPVGVEVVKKEMLETPAGKFDCFKLQLSIGQTMWYSDDEHRYLVKFEAGGAIGTLTAISQRKPGQAVAFRDDTLGISFQAPADWLIQRYGTGPVKKEVLIRTYDPAGDAEDGGMRLVANDTLPAAWRGSARAWAEGWLRDKKDLIVRPDSWKTYNVSGRVGVGCIVDSKEGDKVQTRFFIVALGAKNSELFVVASAPDKFDALKAALEKIVASYRTTK